MSADRSVFKVGDVVVVTDAEHPHHGERGIIMRPSATRLKVLELDWTVRGGSGMEYGVGEREIAHAA